MISLSGHSPLSSQTLPMSSLAPGATPAYVPWEAAPVPAMVEAVWGAVAETVLHAGAGEVLGAGDPALEVRVAGVDTGVQVGDQDVLAGDTGLPGGGGTDDLVALVVQDLRPAVQPELADAVGQRAPQQRLPQAAGAVLGLGERAAVQGAQGAAEAGAVSGEGGESGCPAAPPGDDQRQ
ncbi:hypothetical protein QF037_000558 [Streptomyces canus]|uniref:hypothetical protein n=1 Tax=Streptomyces canus TaxID=58343 RepID=UPI00278A4772|nr:hypothetical protein [Streptomyces canus]MDQ0596213.1 hypothetical protein [Streptomyces canus]